LASTSLVVKEGRWLRGERACIYEELYNYWAEIKGEPKLGETASKFLDRMSSFSESLKKQSTLPWLREKRKLDELYGPTSVCPIPEPEKVEKSENPRDPLPLPQLASK